MLPAEVQRLVESEYARTSIRVKGEQLSRRKDFGASCREDIEQDLAKLLPRDQWDRASHVLIFHGRRICDAQKPMCAECPVKELCPSAGRAEGVGRKPPRDRGDRGAKSPARRTIRR